MTGRAVSHTGHFRMGLERAIPGPLLRCGGAEDRDQVLRVGKENDVNMGSSRDEVGPPDREAFDSPHSEPGHIAEFTDPILGGLVFWNCRRERG